MILCSLNRINEKFYPVLHEKSIGLNRTSSIDVLKFNSKSRYFKHFKCRLKCMNHVFFILFIFLLSNISLVSSQFRFDEVMESSRSRNPRAPLSRENYRHQPSISSHTNFGSSYRGAASTEYHSFSHHNSQPTSYERLLSGIHARPPKWGSSQLSGNTDTPEHPFQFLKKRHTNRRNANLPDELAAMSVQELDSFFEALYKNQTRHARYPNSEFGEGTVNHS